MRMPRASADAGGQGNATGPTQSRDTESRPAAARNPHGGGCALHLSRQRPGRSHGECRPPAHGEQAHELRSSGAASSGDVCKERQASQAADHDREPEFRAGEAWLLRQAQRVVRGDLSLGKAVSFQPSAVSTWLLAFSSKLLAVSYWKAKLIRHRRP